MYFIKFTIYLNKLGNDNTYLLDENNIKFYANVDDEIIFYREYKAKPYTYKFTLCEGIYEDLSLDIELTEYYHNNYIVLFENQTYYCV